LGEKLSKKKGKRGWRGEGDTQAVKSNIGRGPTRESLYALGEFRSPGTKKKPKNEEEKKEECLKKKPGNPWKKAGRPTCNFENGC